MTDPLDALREPVTAADPDPTFAAALRARLERVLLNPRGADMTTTSTERAGAGAVQGARQRSVTPYLAVDGARDALAWYTEVFAGRPAGEPVVMPDGRIGYAALAIGDALLMLADESPELGLLGPTARGGVSQSVVVTVPDVDGTVELAVARGARLDRPVTDYPHGRNGVVTDPFGHRWIVLTPPSTGEAAGAGTAAGRPAHGEVGYLTHQVVDSDRARAFYGAVLGWRFSPGRGPDGWRIEGTAPLSALAGGSDRPGTGVVYTVDDLAGALERVRAQGGRVTEEPEQRPYGLVASCEDDQGASFGLWQPAG